MGNQRERVRKILTTIRQTDGFCCHYCGFRTIRKGQGFGSIQRMFESEGAVVIPQERDCPAVKARRETFDHIKPKVEGGKINLRNGILACEWCNMFKSNSPYAKAKAQIAAMIAGKVHPHQVFIAEGLDKRVKRWKALIDHQPAPVIMGMQPTTEQPA